jgi:hypothetical protein
VTESVANLCLYGLGNNRLERHGVGEVQECLTLSVGAISERNREQHVLELPGIIKNPRFPIYAFKLPRPRKSHQEREVRSTAGPKMRCRSWQHRHPSGIEFGRNLNWTAHPT